MTSTATSLPAHNPFTNPNFPTWCPGCGNFGIWTALKNALIELNLEPHQVVVVFGIGCSGNQANFIEAYGFHGLHGRALPVGEGIALANQGVTTIVVGGDGDGYGEGMAHFIHTIRANPNITYLVHDNQIYGLTKGQTSPTSELGTVSPSTPQGSIDTPVNPMAIALAAGCGFVARGFAGDASHLQQLLVAAIKHRGFSLVDCFQPCVTFNNHNTFVWFYKRIVKIETLKHDPTNLAAAWALSQHGTDHIPLGILYQKEGPTMADSIAVLKSKPLVEQSPLGRDIKPLLEKMR